jgi:hypothetical protein
MNKLKFFKRLKGSKQFLATFNGIVMQCIRFPSFFKENVLEKHHLTTGSVHG